MPTAPADPRGDYVEAIVTTFEGAPGFDVDCLAVGIVEAVGVSEFEDAGVEPGDLARLDSLEGEGVEITSALRETIRGLFTDCIDGSVLVGQLLPDLFPDFPDEVVECLADSMDTVMTSVLADSFIDASADLGPAMFGDIAPLAAACRSEAAPIPGADLAWSDGARPFADALTAQFATPPFEGAIALPLDEADCFVSELVDILGGRLDAVPTVTVGDFSMYLGALTSPAAIGLAIDDETARVMASADLGCIDRARAPT